MSEDNPLAYRIQAYYPNATTDPLTEYRAQLDQALQRAIDLMRGGQHTSINVEIDSLRVVQLWGQIRGLP